MSISSMRTKKKMMMNMGVKARMIGGTLRCCLKWTTKSASSKMMTLASYHKCSIRTLSKREDLRTIIVSCAAKNSLCSIKRNFVPSVGCLYATYVLSLRGICRRWTRKRISETEYATNVTIKCQTSSLRPT